MPLIRLRGKRFKRAVGGTPPSVSNTPVITSRSQSSITVEFAPVGGDLITCGVRYRLADNAPLSYGPWVEVSGSTSSTATVTGLTANKFYEVQTRARNAAGNGPWSTLVRGRTHYSPTQAWHIEGIQYPTQANATLTTNAGYVAWPYDPYMVQAPADPVQWPSAQATNRYYIDNSHVAATNTANTYGYPDKPRMTPPTGALPAGTVVTFGKGHVQANASALSFSGSVGTSASPIWIRGESTVEKTKVSGREIVLNNTEFVFFENFKFDGGNTTNTIIETFGNFSGTPQYLTMRKLQIINQDFISQGGTSISISSDNRSGASQNNHVVIYDVYGNSNGKNVNWSTGDYDIHTIGIGARIQDIAPTNRTKLIWIIDNVLTEVSGNGIQIISTGNPTPPDDWRDLVSYVFIGGVRTGFGRQGGIGVKRSSNILVIENENENSRLYWNTIGTLFGTQYGPDNLWWIRNRALDGHNAYISTDTSLLGTNGRLFMLENIAVNLINSSANADGYSDGCMFTSYAKDYMKRYIFNNTGYGVINGEVNQLGESYAYNNIMCLKNGSLGQASDAGKFVYAPSTSNSNGMKNIYHRLDGSAKWVGPSGNSVTLSAFETDTAGKYTMNIAADPLLSAPSSGDFRLQGGSPALVSPTLTASDGTAPYALFNTLYGITLTAPTYLGAKGGV